MNERDFYAGKIADAADFFGGADMLALLLNVQAREVRQWAAGDATPPGSVLRQVLDLMKDAGRAQVPSR